jgi:LacI family transcriptional regulator
VSRPTIADLAAAAGVGISTVDRVLNGRNPVRRATAERVLAAAERIGLYATGAIRNRLTGSDRPERTLGFVLLQRSTPFYAQLGEALSDATKSAAAMTGRPRVEYLRELTHEAAAETLLKLGREVDAVAVVCADHPRVAQAVQALRDREVPVFALISDLSGPALAGYVGLDNWKLGRTAAWAAAGLPRRSGKVAVFVGSHRYRCQEAAEISFRSYFREQAPGFELLETRPNLEDVRLAYENCVDLLERHPDIVALLVAGGGLEGVIQAMREWEDGEPIVVVGRELAEVARSALIDGVLQMVLSHPLQSMAETLVGAMSRAIEGGNTDATCKIVLPFEIHTPENV